jgi:hypothetical protein
MLPDSSAGGEIDQFSLVNESCFTLSRRQRKRVWQIQYQLPARQEMATGSTQAAPSCARGEMGERVLRGKDQTETF